MSGGIGFHAITVNPFIPKMTGKQFHVLAQLAQAAGPGTAVWAEYEEACEQIELERRYDVQEVLRAYDQLKDEQVPLAEVERHIRCTVSLTLHECQNPDPKTTADDAEWRLSTACQLIMLLERIEDFRHDFNLLNTNSRLAELADLFRDQMRKHAIRYERKDRLDIILKHTFQRLVDDVARARQYERDLRQQISNYSLGEDLRYDNRRFDEPIAAASAAALAIERHFEDRIFAETD